MKITKASDYALVLLSHLANIPTGEKVSVRQVADSCHIPQRFLATIVHRLSKAGLIRSMKGSNGGIWLARPGSEITLLDVLDVIEGPIRMVECQQQKGACRLEDDCPAKGFWDVIHERILDSFGSTTIEEIANYPLPGKEVTTGEPSLQRKRNE